MYKLMIVDDEFHIRDGIANAIPWNEYGVEIVGEAIDGVEALSKIRALLPDIVITDIQMDNMTGLELAEMLKTEFPKIKIIIISGYDEFDYAKKAVELGVFSYILKPIIPEELIEKVKKLIEEIEEDKKVKDKLHFLEQELNANIMSLRDRFLCDLIEGRILQEEELIKRAQFLEIKFDKPYYACLVIDIDNYYNIKIEQGEKQIQLLMLGIKEIVYEAFRKNYDTWVTIDNCNKIVCIIGRALNCDRRDYTKLYEIINKTKENIKDIFKITITIGIGEDVDTAIDIGKSYIEAKRALDYKVIIGKDCIIHINDVLSISGNKYTYPVDKERQILAGILEEDDNKVRYAINNFFKALESQNYLKDRMRIAVMGLFAVVSRKMLDAGIDIYSVFNKDSIDIYKVFERYDTAEEIKNWLIDILTSALDILRSKRSSRIKSVIKKAQEYILQNFDNPD
ncbi:MAG TPA: response regulator, partial [Clostridiaceae bacterium]|nr:response regulator [Clostridiaceae bacterium]